jgi:hypothetical protein
MPVVWHDGSPFNGLGGRIAYRQSCRVIGVWTQPDGIHYQFGVLVQDLVDIASGSYQDDDAGASVVQYHYSWETTWHTAVSDTNSADWSPNGGFGGVTWWTPMLDSGVTGWPETVSWRIKTTTHYAANLGPWLWTSVYGPTLSIGG